VGPGCRIGPKVVLNDYVMLGPEVGIVGADHRFDVPGTPMIFAGRPELRETNIGSDVWIGYRVTILSGISIGRGAIVAANAVVTRNVAAYAVVAGIPARPVSVRFAQGQRAIHDRMLSLPVEEGIYSAGKGTFGGRS
jgi:acetyltransferase-like isoleucine patch superfamily enzyme